MVRVDQDCSKHIVGVILIFHNAHLIGRIVVEVRNKYYQIEWAKKFKSTEQMIERMENPRRPRSVNTIKQYCHSVMIFTKHYLKLKNADQALEKVKVDPFKVIDEFVDYLMKQRKSAPKTVRGMFYGLKFWLKSNDVNTDSLKNVELPKSTRVLTEDRKPTKEELRQILNFAHIRDKALVELAVSSGLRINTITTLKWRNVDREKGIITVQPQMGRKSTRKYFTFITPECLKILDQYRNWRIRHGENVTEESPLIGSIHGIGKERTLPAKSEFGEHVISDTLLVAWKRLLHKAGFTEKSHKWHVLHFHVLRKFFETQCINANVKRPYMEFWMGHSGQFLDDSYFRANVNEHTSEYRKAIEYLSIFETPKIDKRALRESFVEMLAETNPELIKTQAEKQGMTTTEYLDLLKMPKPSKDIEKLLNETEEDCQQIINESELEQWLTKGYRFIAKLDNSKVIVEKNNH